MLGLSWGELVVVLVLGVIFLRPGDLPIVMQKAGMFMRRFKLWKYQIESKIDSVAQSEEVKMVQNHLDGQDRGQDDQR